MAVSAAAATLQTAARLEQLQFWTARRIVRRQLLLQEKKKFLSNIRREIRKRPDPPCEVCHGTGRVDCPPCSGQGRINSVRLAMLPKGEWPKWCRTCGGSGLSYCSRCLGTGEYRYIMGFHFMMASDDTKNHPQQHQSTAARPLNGEDLDSNHGI
ncbi:hypothetical protein OIU76_004977 [Salix suchowensis]|uniref:Uncharacterized protein n=1 Tax=Salix suchowensis TaxID=1278906 RepID=A0ABQ9ABF3_9ROSI|nr:hypothetical protein OIU77_011198 [Salix suchowensis]KAJ6343145.1 hypothetical protein OIU76_004977 [Salix suchowensis]